MQSEAFRYKKTFEHNPKPSKHPNYTVFNDYNVKTCHVRKNVDKMLTGAKVCKKTRNSMVQSILPETFKNDLLFDDVYSSFLFRFILFGVGGMRL